jgi:Sec-independent protein translocase protein TatA
MLNDDKQPYLQPATTLLSQITESGPFQFNNRTASAALSTYLGPLKLEITNSQGVNIHNSRHPSPRATIGKRLPPIVTKAIRSLKSFRQYSGDKGSKLKSQKMYKNKEVMTKESGNDEAENEELDEELAEESDRDVNDEKEGMSQNIGDDQ